MRTKKIKISNPKTNKDLYNVHILNKFITI